MRSWIILCASIALLSAAPAESKIGSIPIQDLIAQSDEIVIAKVIEVVPEADDNPRFASANAIQTLKGSLTGTFRFLASPDWSCSTSDAIKDEVAMFFLLRQNDGTYVIAHAGRGRMPFREVEGKTFLTYWEDVVLPEDAPTIAGPDDRYAFIKSVELTYIESLIQTRLRTQQPRSADLARSP